MNLRPVKLNDVVGQEKVKQCLNISIKASKQKNKALPHTLFDGPPGTGKTTLARALAEDMGVELQIASAASLKSVKSILPYLMKISNHSILFIDEIHRLPIALEEFLYTAVEDFRVDLENDGKTLPIALEEFTLIGATTDGGALSPPLYDRFSIKHHLHLYEIDELCDLIMSNALKLEVGIEHGAAKNLARRSRGTPRIANNLLKWTHDYCLSEGINCIDSTSVGKSMDLMGINPDGLDEQDNKYLEVLGRFGKPVGLTTIVASTNINEDTIMTQIEPFLLQQGMIARTPKGRILL